MKVKRPSSSHCLINKSSGRMEWGKVRQESQINNRRIPWSQAQKSLNFNLKSKQWWPKKLALPQQLSSHDFWSVRWLITQEGQTEKGKQTHINTQVESQNEEKKKIILKDNNPGRRRKLPEKEQKLTLAPDPSYQKNQGTWVLKFPVKIILNLKSKFSHICWRK